MRKVSVRTSPPSCVPSLCRHKRSPNGHLPYGHLPNGHLPYGLLVPHYGLCCAATKDFQTDIFRMDISRTDISRTVPHYGLCCAAKKISKRTSSVRTSLVRTSLVRTSPVRTSSVPRKRTYATLHVNSKRRSHSPTSQPYHHRYLSNSQKTLQ